MTVGPGSNAATGRIRSACLTTNSSATSPRAVRPIHAPRRARPARATRTAAATIRASADRDRAGQHGEACGARSRRPRPGVCVLGARAVVGVAGRRSEVASRVKVSAAGEPAVKAAPRDRAGRRDDGGDGERRAAARRADLGVVLAQQRRRARRRRRGPRRSPSRSPGRRPGCCSGRRSSRRPTAIATSSRMAPLQVGEVRAGDGVREGDGQAAGELGPDGVAGGDDARRGTSCPARRCRRRRTGPAGSPAGWCVVGLGRRHREQDAAADRGEQGDGAGDQRDLPGAAPGSAAEKAARRGARGRRARPCDRAGRAGGARAPATAAPADRRTARTAGRAQRRRAPCRPAGRGGRACRGPRPRVGWSSSSQSLLSPWITNRSPSIVDDPVHDDGVQRRRCGRRRRRRRRSGRPTAGSPGHRCGTAAPC